MKGNAVPAEPSATQSWIGQPVKRVEDARLLAGRGRFIDDHAPCADVHHAAIVRSPHADDWLAWGIDAAVRVALSAPATPPSGPAGHGPV